MQRDNKTSEAGPFSRARQKERTVDTALPALRGFMPVVSITDESTLNGITAVFSGVLLDAPLIAKTVLIVKH